MHIGELIRNARRDRFMTLEALANAAGLTKGFISQVESGKSNPSLASLERLAAALGVTLSTLVDNADADNKLTSSVKSGPGPHLLAARAIYNEEAGLAQLTEVRAGSHFIATVPARSELVSRGQPALKGAAIAICAVLHGGLVIRQASLDTAISAGEIASWNAGSPYVIENRGTAPASALIFIPAGCQIPSVVPLPQTPRRPSGRGDFAMQFEGPMRLVGMRARRQNEQGR